MKNIPVSDSYATVDDDDYALVSQYKWYKSKGSHSNTAYAYAHVGNRTKVLMHKLLMGKEEVDHRDGNGLNNVRENLRESTRSGNNANRGRMKNCKSKYKGVTHDATGKWKAQICKDYKVKYLGLFATEEEAGRAYDKAAKELHGEFARLNFPEG